MILIVPDHLAHKDCMKSQLPFYVQKSQSRQNGCVKQKLLYLCDKLVFNIILVF